MEAKVIEKCLKGKRPFNIIESKEKGWNYDTDYIINKQSGSGNNWANGFFNHGPSIENMLLDKFSSLSEKFDFVDSVVLINSLAGGTGSGLGSYVSILINENFPTVNLFNASVFPHKGGEVVVNSYNTLLSISESYKVSDLMTVINNQDIFDICKEIYKFKKIGFENLNKVISRHLISTLLPVSIIS
jgi:tubulin delta